MFTWVCQRCGKEVDIAETECPHCAVDSGRTKLGSAHGAARGPLEVDYPAATPAEERLPPPKRAEALTSTVPRPAPPPHAFAVKPVHLALFLVAVLLSLAVAVYLARPELFAFGGIKLPKLPRAEYVPLQAGPIEVAGIRTWRDAEAKVKVRAVLVNHTAGTHPDRHLRITLSDPAAEEGTPPAATFEVELEEPLAGRGSQEVETDLLAPEGLTALPDWNRIRVHVEAVNPDPLTQRQ